MTTEADFCSAIFVSFLPVDLICIYEPLSSLKTACTSSIQAFYSFIFSIQFWEFYGMSLDHFHYLFQGPPPSFLRTQLCVFCGGIYVFLNIKTNLCCPNIPGCVTFHWNMVDLAGATLLEDIISPIPATISCSSAGSENSCLTLILVLGFGLAWTCTGLNTCCHNVCEFIHTDILLCPYTVSRRSSTTSGSYTFSFLFLSDPWVLGRGLAV